MTVELIGLPREGTQQLLNYLVNRPYREVAPFVDLIQTARVVTAEIVEPHLTAERGGTAPESPTAFTNAPPTLAS